MRARDRLRVLLVWPGGLFAGGANFGVPQILSLARALERQADAVVDVVDLDMERAFGPIDLERLVDRGYDIIGISCYSSFDYLKVLALAERIRAVQPRAWIVTGGYHPSARPADFTFDGSPIDYVVVGDGEPSIVRLALDRSRGIRPLNRVVGPESVPNPNELLPYRWELLDRYRPIARRMASQAEIYLSRGCPYDCAFCMERAKRDTSWRPLEAEAAVEEMRRLDAFLDLSGWTLFIADALFGMKRAWRRAFLEELARRPLRATRVWLLIRVDLIERDDLELMARANISPGFGLESGDPGQLRRIRKAGKLDSYLDKMVTVSEWARELDVPFGANIIVGHPGETEATMRTSAEYMRRLFLGPKGTHGFLSVDPFRLYPGSPIDEDRAEWEAQTGMTIHRDEWWKDGDPDFLAQWVDPSRQLDFRRALSLKQALFDPIVRELPARFSYRGSAREYFMRAVREQAALATPKVMLRTLGLWHLWQGLTAAASVETSVPLADDEELARVARDARAGALERIRASASVRRALVCVPRERFCRIEDVAESAADRPLSLNDDQTATISALHAYATAFDALDLGPGDRLVDLGGGTGYGAAVAAELVGRSGAVLTIEWDAALATRAETLLRDYPQVTVVRGDAHDLGLWRGETKIACGFAVDGIPAEWLEALGCPGRLVVPVVRGAGQRLVLIEKDEHGLTETTLGAVLFVGDRSSRGAPQATSGQTLIAE